MSEREKFNEYKEYIDSGLVGIAVGRDMHTVAKTIQEDFDFLDWTDVLTELIDTKIKNISK